MGNASPELKAIANATTMSNNEGGWAAAVNQLLDKKEQDSIMKLKTEYVNTIECLHNKTVCPHFS